MSHYRPGQTLRLTDDGRLVTIWSGAPGPGCYWAHLGETADAPRPVVLVRVVHKRDAAKPVVILVEEQ